MSEIRIRNLKTVEHILGAIEIRKVVDGKPMRDYVRPAELIRPGQLSAPLTREQMKCFDTPSMTCMVNAGELDIVIDGRSLKPKAAVKKPAPKSLTATEPDSSAEARQLAELLGGNDEPKPE